MSDEVRDEFNMNDSSDHGPFEGSSASNNSTRKTPKKITFDDFQITRAEQQHQVDEERQAWKEREERLEREKPAFIRYAVPRLKSLRDEMIGVQNKLSLFKKGHKEEPRPTAQGAPPAPEVNAPYFAEHERSVIRIVRRSNEDDLQEEEQFANDRYEEQHTEHEYEPFDKEDLEEEYIEAMHEGEEEHPEPMQDALEMAYEESEHESYAYQEEETMSEVLEEASASWQSMPAQTIVTPSYQASEHNAYVVGAEDTEDEEEDVALEPKIEPALKSFFDALRAFDSFPRRANDPRDPRTDFVVLLGELLDILRDQLDATSAMFFWVNAKKQELVLESAALDDRAYQFLAGDKRFPIELDAVSRIVTKRRPELHTTIAPQAELDLIPYYRDAVGIASFAGMPVMFGDGLVAVLTVDSTEPEYFTAETLRILTNHSKLISGLVRSYIEKYDLLASARTLDAARKLYEIVSPDSSLRVLREQRRNPDYVLRALTEAAGDIIEWDWLAAASFDDSRRLWSITSLQSKRGGAYAPPMTPVSLEESLVGKCLTSGRSVYIEALNAQSIRFNIEEDRQNAIGHSFMVIPIRTATKNYGALAIEHSDKSRFTDADLETLEHLARSAATALEIVALGEIVGERALTDLLTGVYNKRGLLARTNEELARAMQFDEPLTFALFEIDGAAEFASRFSQEDSDTIVLAITRLLKFGARPFDVVARTEEHTFAVLLVKMTDEEAYLWSEKMRKMIVSEVIAIGKRSYSVTVSIGVSGARRRSEERR